MKIRFTQLSISLAFILSLVMLPLNRLSASHAMGAELTYVCNGGSNYTFTLHFYRDCSGITAPASFIMSYTGCASGSYTLSQVSSAEVTPLCPSELPNSTCNGGTMPGVEEYIYTYTGNIAACSNWIFSIREGNRNSSISTMTSPGSEWLYVETWLNNSTISCNSSPQFTNLPVPYICVGQPYIYNHGATDPDGDSLSYQLVNALTNAGTSVAYSAGYSGANPIASTPAAAIDPVTGNITINPTAVQVAVITVLVTEWRNGVAIGSVMRDIQVNVLNCPAGNSPALSGIDSTTNYSMIVCVGQAINIDIWGYDPDTGDSLSLGWNNGIPSGNMNITPGTPGTPGIPAGPQILFQETWPTSGSFGTWTTAPATNNWIVGASYQPAGGSGSNAYFSFSPTVLSYSHTLTSPTISAVGHSTVTMDYLMLMNAYSATNSEYFQVQYKTSASGTWTTLETFGNYTTTNIDYVRTAQNLAGMAGNNFQVRFRAYGSDSWDMNGWGLDEIYVYGDNSPGTPGTPGTYPYGTFTWTPGAGDVGNHFFTMNVSDNGCPISQNQAIAYQITVQNCVLPSDQVQLEAAYEPAGVYLNWNSEIEQGTKEYVLERSLNGSDFEDIASVDAKGSHSSYDHMDQDIINNETMWYRLRIIDAQGNFAHSNIVEVARQLSDQVLIFPNPFKHEFMVNTPEAGAYKVIDMAGRVIASGEFEAGRNEVSLNDQPKGMYLLIISNDSGTESFRITKQ